MNLLTRLGSRMMALLIRVGAPFGSMALLTVPGRRTGKLRSTPVAVTPHGGGWRLLSVHGESDWARNLRAAGEGTLAIRGTPIPITATELDPTEAAPFIRSALEGAGRMTRRIVGRHFAASVDDPIEAWREEAASHPLFHLSPLELPGVRGTAILRVLAGSVLLGLAVQVALAGLGAFGLEGAWEAHRTFGVVAEAASLVAALVALGLRRAGVRWPLVGIFLLITLQHGSATLGGLAGAFHAVDALVMVALASTVLRRLRVGAPIPAAPHLRIGEASLVAGRV